ncbi:MAG TPA: MFS transporter, partial [Caulobacteraceae bacterium]|nr:MFS transporter [Caulobacteraceae bacterium]
MAAVTAEATRAARPGLRTGFASAAVLVVVGVISTTLGQEQLLGRLPLTNLLKNTLHESRTATSAFFFLAGLAWYFKPLAGILTDAFPVLGSRRRFYLIASATVGSLVWLSVCFLPQSYTALLSAMILLGVFMMLASTVVGAVLVETAHGNAASGRLTALRFAVQYGCIVIGALAGGWLATLWFGWTAMASAAVLFLIVPVALLLLKEDPVSADAGEIIAEAGRQLKQIATAGPMWAAGGLIALFYIAPGFTTALFYRQQNELHMLPPAQGLLSTAAALSGIAGAITYAIACRQLKLRTLMIIALSLATVTTLGYVFYDSVPRAYAIATVNTFCEAMATTALVDLSVRATPRGSEGLGYALMISINNLARLGTDFLGSTMLDKLHLPFSTLVLINAATTAIAVPLVMLMPAVLVMRRETDSLEPVEQLVGGGQDGA